MCQLTKNRRPNQCYTPTQTFAIQIQNSCPKIYIYSVESVKSFIQCSVISESRDSGNTYLGSQEPKESVLLQLLEVPTVPTLAKVNVYLVYALDSP